MVSATRTASRLAAGVAFPIDHGERKANMTPKASAPSPPDSDEPIPVSDDYADVGATIRGGRNIERHTGRAYRPYATAIGEVALGWNDLHERLGFLFAISIVKAKSHEELVRAWSGLDSDRAKRKMFRQSLAVEFRLNYRHRPKLADDLRHLLNLADKLENNRNDAVHVPLIIWTERDVRIRGVGSPGVKPDMSTRNQRSINMVKHDDMLAKIRWCRDAIFVLRRYCGALTEALLFDKKPWPKRPSLPNHTDRKIQSRKKPPPRTK
jgi:hypothetical protein